MAELPEIAKYAAQMDEQLRGKTIADLVVLQEKCTNVPTAEFRDRVIGATVVKVKNTGKWIFTELDNGETILLSFGMGADVFYFLPGAPDPEKYQIKLVFSDGSGYTARFWWFGSFLVWRTDDLAAEPKTAEVAIDPYDPGFTREHFAGLIAGKRTGVKAFLLNQKNIGGIGNVYVQDILFEAGLHPKTKLSDLSPEAARRLYDAVANGVLIRSRAKGSLSYEKDFHGEPGGFCLEEDFLVGYTEGDPCPVCCAEIVIEKVAGTTSYLCPVCQPAP